ncbi:MAG: hypothetical protein ACREOH_22795 [Candidatus Entotheonellia bacterium]
MRKRPLNLDKIRAGLAKLDALVEAHPELTRQDAQARLATWVRGEEARHMPVSEKIFVRMDPELVSAIDQYAERIRAEHPGFRPTRSDAIRALLYKAIEQMAAEDQADIEAAHEALADPERIPYEEARRELGL